MCVRLPPRQIIPQDFIRGIAHCTPIKDWCALKGCGREMLRPLPHIVCCEAGRHQGYELAASAACRQTRGSCHQNHMHACMHIHARLPPAFSGYSAPTVQSAGLAKDKAVLVALSKCNPDVFKLSQDFLCQATRSVCCGNGEKDFESWGCHGGSQENLP